MLRRRQARSERSALELEQLTQLEKVLKLLGPDAFPGHTGWKAQPAIPAVPSASCGEGQRVTELFRLEKASKITESNPKPGTGKSTTKPRYKTLQVDVS